VSSKTPQKVLSFVPKSCSAEVSAESQASHSK